MFYWNFLSEKTIETYNGFIRAIDLSAYEPGLYVLISSIRGILFTSRFIVL